MKGMTYTEISEANLPALIGDHNWVFQQKVDGTRVITRITPAGIEFLSRAGAPLKHAAALLHLPGIRAALAPLQVLYSEVILDGELILETGDYLLFDLVRLTEADGTRIVDADDTQLVRYDTLDWICSDDIPAGPVRILGQDALPADKSALVAGVRRIGGEGIVAKHTLGTWEEGTRVKHVVKVKFVKSADVVVIEANRGRNEAGREIGNITFGVHLPDGTLTTLGRCSIIGKPHVEPGDVIEIAYLKFETAPVQPRMVKVRDDKAATECTLDQFGAYSYATVTR